MYVTLTATGSQQVDATDLGYLLHKHPDRAQSFAVSGGTAHVFYPEATADRCTVALLVEIDPIGLVRRGRRGDAFALGQYVNDRPYVASSLVAVSLGKVFRTAMSGRCDARPDLVGLPLDLEIHVPVLPSVGGDALVRDLFAPLGWQVETEPLALDETVPAWGQSRYVDVHLGGRVVLADALSHLYVLLPVLDAAKHYWVSDDEVDKLLAAAGDWLPTHPARDAIVRGYLKHQRDLVSSATARLAERDDLPAEVLEDADVTVEPVAPALATLRKEAVVAALRAESASRIVDLGCGEGALLRELVRDPAYSEVVGADVSARALELAERRLQLDRMPDSQRDRLRLLQSSVTYRDDRLRGYDAVVLMEVVEHLDADRLPALESTVFAHARPTTVVLTTPNAEHNVRFPHLAAGTLRHPDHRFEWSRAELATWARGVADRNGYTVRFVPVGEDDPEVGPPTQLAVFRRTDRAPDGVA